MQPKFSNRIQGHGNALWCQEMGGIWGSITRACGVAGRFCRQLQVLDATCQNSHGQRAKQAALISGQGHGRGHGRNPGSLLSDPAFYINNFFVRQSLSCRPMTNWTYSPKCPKWRSYYCTPGSKVPASISSLRTVWSICLAILPPPNHRCSAADMHWVH